MASGAAKVAGFVIAGAITLYILYSLLPGLFSVFGVLSTNATQNGNTYLELAPSGAEPIAGAVIIVFVALVLLLMYQEYS